MKIAVDGASATGKSTVCGVLSKELNILHLDTGAMYRIAALKADRMGIELNFDNVGKLLKDLDIDIKYIDGTQKEFLDGACVSNEIRQHHISKLASDISAFSPVRIFMMELQRKIASKISCIMDGRDIGTYVLPNADYKFFLTAELDCRANRRYKELLSRGQDADFEKVREDIKVRDFNDTNREIAPLKKADNAIEIDSTSLTVDQVVALMLKEIKR
ncbi:MAG: (d)CMP kinase [Firmicutes bacterium]|nr:(d)CMP kinase [Bacillota bacterium]